MRKLRSRRKGRDRTKHVCKDCKADFPDGTPRQRVYCEPCSAERPAQQRAMRACPMCQAEDDKPDWLWHLALHRERECLVCERYIRNISRSDAKYCSPVCRQQAHRERLAR
jgi:hypothetical protein